MALEEPPQVRLHEVLTRSFYPLTDPAANFEHYGIRGPLLLLRFIPAVLLAALVGTFVGRQLPALLLAGLMVAGLGAGLSVLRPFGAPPMERAPAERPMDSLRSMHVGVVYRDADGAVMAEAAALALMSRIDPEGPEPDQSQLPRETFLVIPGERLPEVVAREAVVIGLGSTGLAVLLFVLVRRRRPS